MLICRRRLRNTFNVLMLRMSSEQIHLQVSPKLFGVNSWIPQMIRQWNRDFWSCDRKCTGPKGQRCSGKLPELTADDICQIAGAGDQQLQRLAHSSQWKTLKIGAEDNNGLSQQACTALSHFQVSPKLFGVNSWILQMIRQACTTFAEE